jgi:hypothetical protein
MSLYAYLSVRMEQLGSYLTDFHGIWYLRIFGISVEGRQVWLKPGGNNWVNEHLRTFMIFRRIVLMTSHVSDKSFKDHPKTNFMLYIFSPENRAVYEIMWKYNVWAKQTTYDNIIRCILLHAAVTKATDTHPEYVIVLCHDNSGYANALQCYVYMYIAYLVTIR